MKNYLYILLLMILIFYVASEEEFCSVNNKECMKNYDATENLKDLDNKYEEYYKAIKDAEDNYKECDAKKCGCYENVIKQDLKIFKQNGINEELINESATRGTLYQIINKKLYRNKVCMFPSRCAGIEYFLLQIAKNMSDIEFVINTRDYPQSNKNFGEPLPIFSFSKTPDYYDIMYPAWSFWEGGPAISLYPRGLGRWDQHRKSLDKISKTISWDNKETKAFFRGSRTSSERDNLILLSRKNPEIIDAQYTKNQAWKSDEDTLHQPPASEVSLEDHCKYKYLFNYRGVAASFRHKHLFLCNSLVFHVGNEWTEFYYSLMKPWIHYIPVAKDADQRQLKRLIEFAKDNDSIAKQIAQRGRDFIWKKLQMSDIVCYWRKLLKNYAKHLTYQPILHDNVIQIKEK
ncbi:hypothetical protein PV328_009528 [Microctonus aethiopoides]|uniref:Glycosyl transferase CAP10 domain-containing protein n=1 Tax=Microctonus aethiopoides TaxID=144406 RepID=A0AA39EW50_9HYME|nr:hypothetical protein PV328_009528 [Microctonus aethiopoides]